MKLISLAVLMLSVAATPALAEDWVLATVSDDSSAALLIDVDTIGDEAGGIHGLRVLTVMKVTTQSFDALVSDVRVDCGAHKIRVGRTSAHDLTGKQLLVEEDGPELGWDAVTPGSNYDTVVKMVCQETPMSKAHYGAKMPIAKVRAELVRRGS